MRSNGSKPNKYYSTSKPAKKVQKHKGKVQQQQGKVQVEQVNTCPEQQIIPMTYYNASFMPNYGKLKIVIFHFW